MEHQRYQRAARAARDRGARKPRFTIGNICRPVGRATRIHNEWRRDHHVGQQRIDTATLAG